MRRQPYQLPKKFTSLYGSSAGFSETLDLDGLNGTNGFRLAGSGAEQPGFSVSSVGDVNNDQFDDMIIGAPASDPDDRANAGSAYVVFCPADLPATINLSGLNGTSGFRLDGAAAGDGAGTSVANVGDVNNDRFDDVVIGGPGANPELRTDAGSPYVVLGTNNFSGTLELSGLNSVNGFRLDGAAVGNEFGISVSAPGNVNNDDFDDVLVGSPGADLSGGSAAGSTYVFFGTANFSGSTNITSLNGVNGFRLDGVDVDDRSGQSVAEGGEVNSDGFFDVIVG